MSTETWLSKMAWMCCGCCKGIRVGNPDRRECSEEALSDEREWMEIIEKQNTLLEIQNRLLMENHEVRFFLGQLCNQVQLSAPLYPDTGLFLKGDTELAQSNKRNGHIVGEIAFQLERRILAHVFPGKTWFYGFTVSNIPEKIEQVSMNSRDVSVDEKKYRAMAQRYLDLTARLKKMGYRTHFHPIVSECLINIYGILEERSDLSSNPMYNNPADLRKVVIDIVPSEFLGFTLLLLNCLCELSKEDNKALFAW